MAKEIMKWQLRELKEPKKLKKGKEIQRKRRLSNFKLFLWLQYIIIARKRGQEIRKMV